ncbi:hypothetical protein KM043_002323 [Ampulex compressa]|nr:hypothetical protein KM043_002323 [Ampulex compressa]
MYLLFQVYLTEWVPFEFRHNNVFDNEASGVTLVEALSMDDIPIMQHLGYLDLVTLAQKDKIRRGILFTLSQPGGHPYNWNSVIEKCATLIKKFSKDLSAASTKAQDQLSNTASTLSATGGSLFQKEYVYHMRNLAMEKTSVTTAEDIDSKQNENSETFIHRFVKAKWQAFISYLLSKPLVHYVFGEQEASKVKHVLFNAQSVIWAIEAVSSLAVLSLTEDSYGIVQKDLPLLIDCLLMLKQALDKLQKSNIFARKDQGEDRLVKQIFTSLRTAARRSLYRVVTNFEAYISDLALEPVAIEQLQSFLNYRE